ncbi:MULTISPECIES: dTDP-4-dehydrorhamnose 3,5-epimerase family protein [Pseudonocardia]|uniref:dTDP-4-dehydrorhamnose 3,5-epimerase n=3 Tax=Pseudonocardia TaxID=1847 RepID=A0A1I5IU05_PSUAM|nr:MULTISPECIES: dTDP-4-dehydrorhamnose 3,5-epimerase family protein [Pseudonocardia]OSY35024.1 dTDP-4-dehydrorhamnose 3,5-epimerase [Pseudonocardia autotrophica]TDN65608.1 dTDP-4-dehydrorhamnose 3,5-epimerase [Pseudonocardia autotrophica]SFO63899.1 dTDP-4-dehydrorhamnose 3,5-epimerase [Pseudonocardia ammonioxydans]BBG05752.1 dTDP-4-dehydrorhamnose 3,5-epimerase [Pseudonocardia autotrophica]GEC28162.1 dTDP-4-dehydrorhamnose 3,5-epimerase [Pseudonocardia saturnea]
MHVRSTPLPGVLLFAPSPHRDERGFFSRTAEARTLTEAGIDPAGFVQDSQSRSRQGVVRGLHGRTGAGEAKLVRCSHGALFDVVVDARPDSPTFGQSATFRLDDDNLASLYLPRGVLHGFQALTETADICYRIDAEHDPGEDIAVRYDDPELAIPWPVPVSLVSDRDATAASWREAVPYFRRHGRGFSRAR